MEKITKKIPDCPVSGLKRQLEFKSLSLTDSNGVIGSDVVFLDKNGDEFLRKPTILNVTLNPEEVKDAIFALSSIIQKAYKDYEFKETT